MRILDADTLAAQAAPSPEYHVTASFEARGRGPFDAPVGNFTRLAVNLPGGGGGLTAVVRRGDGAFLRFYAVRSLDATEIRVALVANPAMAAAWSPPAWDRRVTLAGLSVFGLDALVVGNTIRLYHSDAGSVRWQASTDGGVTWSAAVTVETVVGATLYDLGVCYREDFVGGPWYVGYSVWAGGSFRPRVVGGAGGPETVYGAGWRFGGFHFSGEEGSALFWLGLFIFRDAEVGPTRIVYGTWSPGSGLVGTAVVDWTHGGLFGLRLAVVRTRRVVNSTTMLVLETAYNFGAYLTWSVVYGDAAHGPILGGQPMAIDESMLMGNLGQEEMLGTNNTLAGTLVDDAAGALYYCSPSSTWRAAAMGAPTGVYLPIKYTHETGGNLEILFSARDFPLAPLGSILVLERTVTKHGIGGSQVVRARVVKREHGTDRVRLLAVDALGELGIVRLRRPCILDRAASDYANAAIACFRAGLAVKDAAGAAAWFNENAVTLKPGENIAGVLHRMGLHARIWLVPDNGGAYGLTMLSPGQDVLYTGEYGDTPQPYGGVDEHPLIRAADVVDARRYAVAVFMGTASTDPEDGGGLAMALGPQVTGCRPVPVAVTNRLMTGAALLDKAAQAEADRQRKIAVDGVMTAPANLALELYDLVQVTAPALGWAARALRVHGLVEKWEEGRLVQEMGLGEP